MRALSLILGILMLSILRSCYVIHFWRKTRVHLSFSTSWFSNSIEIVHFLVRDPYVWTIVLDCLLSYKGSIWRYIHSTRCFVLPVQWHKVYHLLLTRNWFLMRWRIMFELKFRRFIFYRHSVYLTLFFKVFMSPFLPESFDLIMASRYS
jgi:hypothetical protein